MKSIKRLIVLVALLSIVMVLPVSAASKSAKAKKAYRTAISNKKIHTSSYMKCAIKDITGDKVPELLIMDNGDAYFYIYTYKSNKVKRMLKYSCEWEMYYNPSTNIFSEEGEGDGGWRVDHKLKSGKLKEVCRYQSEWIAMGKAVYYKKTGSKKTYITQKAYMKKWNEVQKKSCLKEMTKKQLMKKLK